MANCNSGLCSICRNQYTCQKYLSYIGGNKAFNQQSVQSSQQVQYQEISPMSIEMSNVVDSSSILQELYAYKDSMIDTVTTRYLAIENQIKSIVESVSSLKEAVDGLSEKLARLDGFIEMVEKHNSSDSGVNYSTVNGENGLSVYTGGESDKVWVEKKSGLFGLGKTKWVEEDKK